MLLSIDSTCSLGGSVDVFKTYPHFGQSLLTAVHK